MKAVELPGAQMRQYREIYEMVYFGLGPGTTFEVWGEMAFSAVSWGMAMRIRQYVAIDVLEVADERS